jgi:hypothetical protein
MKYTTINVPNEISSAPTAISLPKDWTSGPNWNPQHPLWCPAQHVPDVLKNKGFSDNLVGVEIGVDRGATSEYLIKNLPNLKLYGVDPYVDYQDWWGWVAWSETAYMEMRNRLDPYGENFVLVRKTSDDAAASFEDESLDFVFVDGIHTYEQVMLDCQNYYSKVKKGGFFGGHDYTSVEGVGVAAREFAASVGGTIQNCNQDVWYWWKD